MTTHTATLRTWPEAHGWLQRLTDWVKANTLQGRAVHISAGPEKRSTAQNAMLHAMLSEIAREHEWAGKKRDAETWKRLFVAAWCRARNESIELLPALDGHGVDIVFRRTSKMTVAEVGDLIDYVEAWRSMESSNRAMDRGTR